MKIIIRPRPPRATSGCYRARYCMVISSLALDVVFNEDKACIRNDNAAENMDILRKWAIAVLVKAKTKTDQSIKSLMRKNSMAIKHRVAAVNKILHA